MRIGGTSPRLAALRGYLVVTGVLNLGWEVAQLPLYTIWKEGTSRSMALAVLHCAAGDVFLPLLALLVALVVAGGPAWPQRRAGRVAALTLLAGLAISAFVEWLNAQIWRNWAYSDLMPILPPFATGLSPMLQWLLIPFAALWMAHWRGAARWRRR